MAPDGTMLDPETEGEIVIRGPNVTAGYENNPAANESAFADGWSALGSDSLRLRAFRAGDESVMVVRNHTFTAGDLETPY